MQILVKRLIKKLKLLIAIVLFLMCSVIGMVIYTIVLMAGLSFVYFRSMCFIYETIIHTMKRL